MTSKPSFKQAQVDFAAHIRNPLEHPKPDNIEDRRMGIYRELFINSITGLLAGSFPVIRTLYDDTAWEQLIRGYYKVQHNKTPHFPEIPREFVEYLKDHDADPDKPFLYELAHYEWIELHLEKHSFEIERAAHVDPQDLLYQVPVVSPLVRLQAYHYPVQQIKTDYQPKVPAAQPTFMLIWRDTEYLVHFSELQPFSALLLEQLINNKTLTGRQLLTDLAQQHQYPDVDQFIQFGLQTMQQWFDQDIILNTNK